MNIKKSSIEKFFMVIVKKKEKNRKSFVENISYYLPYINKEKIPIENIINYFQKITIVKQIERISSITKIDEAYLRFAIWSNNYSVVENPNFHLDQVKTKKINSSIELKCKKNILPKLNTSRVLLNKAKKISELSTNERSVRSETLSETSETLSERSERSETLSERSERSETSETLSERSERSETSETLSERSERSETSETLSERSETSETSERSEIIKPVNKLLDSNLAKIARNKNIMFIIFLFIPRKMLNSVTRIRLPTSPTTIIKRSLMDMFLIPGAKDMNTTNDIALIINKNWGLKKFNVMMKHHKEHIVLMRIISGNIKKLPIFKTVSAKGKLRNIILYRTINSHNYKKYLIVGEDYLELDRLRIEIKKDIVEEEKKIKTTSKLIENSMSEEEKIVKTSKLIESLIGLEKLKKPCRQKIKPTTILIAKIIYCKSHAKYKNNLNEIIENCQDKKYKYKNIIENSLNNNLIIARTFRFNHKVVLKVKELLKKNEIKIE